MNPLFPDDVFAEPLAPPPAASKPEPIETPTDAPETEVELIKQPEEQPPVQAPKEEMSDTVVIPDEPVDITTAIKVTRREDRKKIKIESNPPEKDETPLLEEEPVPVSLEEPESEKEPVFTPPFMTRAGRAYKYEEDIDPTGSRTIRNRMILKLISGWKNNTLPDVLSLQGTVIKFTGEPGMWTDSYYVTPEGYSIQMADAEGYPLKTTVIAPPEPMGRRNCLLVVREGNFIAFGWMRTGADNSIQRFIAVYHVTSIDAPQKGTDRPVFVCHKVGVYAESPHVSENPPYILKELVTNTLLSLESKNNYWPAYTVAYKEAQFPVSDYKDWISNQEDMQRCALEHVPNTVDAIYHCMDVCIRKETPFMTSHDHFLMYVVFSTTEVDTGVMVYFFLGAFDSWKRSTESRRYIYTPYHLVDDDFYYPDTSGKASTRIPLQALCQSVEAAGGTLATAFCRII